ncbi:hypothetical protein GGS23DRAFT_261975 [Durotheca rogersii]|uniref:uncharacterized protein n=1 Tax=Durotheca rogersii TaxID=419775 RepID=UPI00221FDC5A|nr:uncharacterized protein GGS23DRAFT_261975 [Durotheca rogersii]KAI5859802.1 hypothetical protein GGS23DRAFT_261975 [Durotheca rogersii]
MKSTSTYLLAALAAGAAAKDFETFAVLRFNNEPGRFAAEGRMDPIVNPGVVATHSHSIMGGSNFATTIEGDQLLGAQCTSAKIANDHSNYWVPNLWFQSPVNGTFKKVPLFYMNVYYKFDATHDEIKAFPPGLKIMSGDVDKRTPPATGSYQLDPNQGEIQPVQWSCPKQNPAADRYPPGSDGKTAGLADPLNKEAGAGFPVTNCDGYSSPLRQDIHMPSCYNPEAGLDDYKNNMAFPSMTPDWKWDCPSGWIHVPHLFYEVYYDTPQFQNDWDEDGQNQPFVLSNGDRTGYSSHADFVSGWDPDTLQRIIDTCNAGTLGMDTCPDIPGGLNFDTCQIPAEFPDPTEEWISALPGEISLTGWGL